MVVLNYVWLLLCTWLTLCAAPPHAPGHSYSRSKRNQEQITLDFTLLSNSSSDCSAGLSNQGVSVTVFYRTLTFSGNSSWIPMQTIVRPPNDTLSCWNHSVELIVIDDASDIQFRFVQEEHAGGYCNCWAVNNNMVLRIGPPSATLGDIACSNSDAPIGTLTDCPNTASLVLCGGSASVPRGFVTRVYSLRDNVSSPDCRDGQLVDNVGPSPVCAGEPPDTPYISISFQLNIFHNKSIEDSCNPLETLDEGVELAIGNSSGDGHWVPLKFYSANDLNVRDNSIDLGVVTNSNSSLSLRGYSVPVEMVTADTTQNIRTVRICGSEFLEAGVQFRWLQTVTVRLQENASTGLPGKDVWTLDNVTVVVHNDTERRVLSEDFESGSLNNFRVKAGKVANNSCGLSGQSLAFGMDPAIAGLEGRIGVTPPLDLRPDVRSVEPKSDTTLPTSEDTGCNLAAIDLVFVLDASGSIGIANFSRVLDLVRDTVTTLGIGPDEGQVAVIRFASNASVIFSLTAHDNEPNLLAAVNGIAYTGGGTDTAAALNLLVSDGFTGARPQSDGVPRFAVVVTDAMSNDRTATTEAATRLHAVIPEITVFAVGIGDIDLNELEQIASTPSTTFVRTISGFNTAELKMLTQTLRQEACQASISPAIGNQIQRGIGQGLQAFFVYQLPEQGFTIQVTAGIGRIAVCGSTTIERPSCGNMSLHDWRREVTGFADIYITPDGLDADSLADMVGPEGRVISRIFVTLEGLGVNNSFVLNTTLADTRISQVTSLQFSSALDQSTQEFIDRNNDSVYFRIQQLSPEDAIKMLAELTPPPPINETVVVYLMADILDRIETNVSMEFSLDFIEASSNILERVSEREQEESSTITIAGSSLLRVMDRFALEFFSVINSSGSLNGDNIDLRLQVQSGSEEEGEEFMAFDQDDSQITIPRELIRNLNLTEAQVVSHLYNNMSGLLPASLPGMDSNGTNATILASSIISTALQCETGICNTRDMTLQRPVRIVIPHPENIQEMVEDSEIVCVFWEFDNSSGRLVEGNWATDGCYRNDNLSNTTATVCECNHLTHFAILLSPGPVAGGEGVRISLEVIGAVGVSISVVAMVITIITFVCLKSLWSMRNYIHINLCISLIVAQVTFIAGVEPRGSIVGCQVVAVLLHYFFLVTFMWMLMEGVVLYVALVRVFVTHQARYIIAFTAASYGLPLLYMCLTIPLGFALDNGPHYGNDQACWLRYDTYFIWAIIIPVIIIILANIGFFIMAITIMYRHHRRQVHEKKTAEVKYWMKGSISLVVVMGITFIIGIATSGTVVLLPIAYIFTIFMAFQGLIIFIVFVVLSKQVREAYSKWWKIRVAESEFLSKYFGENEKPQTTSNPNTAPLLQVPMQSGSRSVSPIDHGKHDVPSSNGGLEKSGKSAVDNDYQEPSQLQSDKKPKPDSKETTAL